MYVRMCEQVFLTVFVISVAFGTEAEFEGWIIQLGTSADRTFVLCDRGAAAGMMDFTLRPHGLPEFSPTMNLPRIEPGKISVGKVEDSVVDKGSYDRYGQISAAASHGQIPDDGVDHDDQIDDSHPFHLDGDDEPEKDLPVRVEGRKCQEYRKTDVVCRIDVSGKDIDRSSADEMCDECADDGQQHTVQHIEGITEGADRTLQRFSDGIIEEDDGQNKKEDTGVTRRRNDPGDKTPDLSLQDHGDIQTEPVHDLRIEHLEKISHDITADDDLGKIRNPEPAVFLFQFLHKIHKNTSLANLGFIIVFQHLFVNGEVCDFCRTIFLA